MSDAISLAGSLFVGAALGIVFFGGLWWTVRRGLRSSRPAVLFFFSMLVRTAFVLTGFYLVSAGGWRMVLACLVGFIAGRFVIKAGTAPKRSNNAP